MYISLLDYIEQHRFETLSFVTFHYTISYNATGLVVNLFIISESIYSVYHYFCLQILSASDL